ncbi:MAG: response regulator [Clostridiaceae bacterium]|nr:response regulator [Clostridiaceae bacterium]
MYKVMIADDIEILRYDLKRMKVWSETKDFAVEGEAENGLDALKKLRASDYDLLITDIKMPIMGGMDLLKAVSQEKLCPCVVLLSDYTEFAYAREGLLHGAFDYLGKPINNKDLTDLLSRVKTFLDDKKQEQDKIKQWEGLAEEAFFPASYVEQVASFLIKAQDDAIEATDSLLETVGAALNYDVKKATIILENASKQVFTEVVKAHGWIKLYTDIDDTRKLNFSEDQSWEDICETVHTEFDNLLKFLKKFVIWKDTDSYVKKACREVLYNIENNISVKSIAENLFISKAYLSERFKQITGVSLSKYIFIVKMQRAKYLLTNSTLKNYEIAEILGYNDHEYFSKVFKKNFGTSPALFRKKNTNI